MPRPSAGIKAIIGPLAGPFERTNKRFGEQRQATAEECEDFRAMCYDASKDGKPEDVRIALGGVLDDDAKYLWIINDKGLFLLWEPTYANPSTRHMVCHTNLTAGEPAYQGGQLWFLEDGSVIIDFHSGRYGATSNLEEDGVLAYFKLVGYEVRMRRPL